MITQTTESRQSITWTVSGLLLEAHRPFADRFAVVVRHIDCPAVLWDGEFPTDGRILDDLPANDFTQEVLARIVRDQADRLGRFVYTQDEVRGTLQAFAAALPETFRP